MRKTAIAVLAGAVLIGVKAADAAIMIDGTLDSQYGSILAVQTNTSNTGDMNGNYDSHGNPTRTNSQNQLSNAYGYIDTANNQLDIFLGGAINLDNEFLHLAIDANPNTGVASLAKGVHSGVNDTGNVADFTDQPGGFGNGGTNLNQVVFDAGFRPETLLTFQFNGGNNIYDDNLLTGTEYKDNYGADPQNGPVTRGPAVGDPAGGVNFTVAVNNALSGTLETAATAASATTGFEIGISLSDLGYVPGSPVNVAAFISQGSASQMTNQVLGANPGYTTDSFAQYNFDFTANQGVGGHNAPGDQFFTISPVPEPASLGFLAAIGGIGLLTRRKRFVK
jgi:hypothetical protein